MHTAPAEVAALTWVFVAVLVAIAASRIRTHGQSKGR